MPSAAADDTETTRRDFSRPYGRKHQIPTVQQYRAFKDEQKVHLAESDAGGNGGASENDSPSRMDRWFSRSGGEGQAQQPEQGGGAHGPDPGAEGASAGDGGGAAHPGMSDTSQVGSYSADPKTKRKQMKHRNVDLAEREVTDPVTHLPLTIRDFSDDDLREARDSRDEDEQELEQDGDVDPQDQQQYRRAAARGQQRHDGMNSNFPSVNVRIAQQSLANLYSRAILFGMGALLSIGCVWLALFALAPSAPADRHGSAFSRYFNMRMVWLSLASVWLVALAVGVVIGLPRWINVKAKHIWDDAVWESRRQQDSERAEYDPETTKWLNNLVGSIWPMMNPDLFSSVVDMIEDILQASLPSMVRMVSVEDLGQGSEAIRFLGVKWLPQGAAAKTVSSDGSPTQSKPDQSQGEDDVKESGAAGADSETGLKAEEGAFCNLEAAIAYQASSAARKRHDRGKNAHLYLAFYLPGGIKLPVWVELKGLVGSLRLRLQLTPDPPFVALCTLTFCGQPKLNVSCTPLLKKGINILDLPLISNFVQSAIDAAMNEYVAPKSLTLDLKSMLAGDDFKHDTFAKGVLVVRIRRAFGFREGDTGIPLIKDGGSDPYVSVGWAKFGKPLFSTRVLVGEMQPYFEEEAYLTVGPEEVDAEEALRLQLWDSDRTSADDDLGRIEVPLKELMKDERSSGAMWARTDAFEALGDPQQNPGSVEWAVGYYSKVGLLDSQVAYKAEDGITSLEQLREQSYRRSAKKLREARRANSTEAEQTKTQDFEDLCTDMITTSVPTQVYPSGILSVQIHQITGLQFEKLNRPREPDGAEVEGGLDEGGEDLPNAYCTVMLNHQKVFKTRTKPRNAKPFFNAGTERFVRDWRTSTIMVSIRDARVHEDPPLIGVVHISVGDIFKRHGASRINESFPIAGGIGYGRIRISLCFRSVQLQPAINSLGWEWGTVEVAPQITADEQGFPSELQKCRIKARTALGKGHLWSTASDADEHKGKHLWQTRKGRPLFIPVRKRYSTALIFEFRSTRLLLPDQSSAFAVLRFKDVPDEQEMTLTLPVFRGDVRRAEVNALPEEELGERVASLTVRVTFFRGLGKWHRGLARHDDDVANVLESLIAARDENLLEGELVGDPEWVSGRRGTHGADPHGDDDDDDDDSSDDSGSDDGHEGGSKKGIIKRMSGEGVVDALREKKRHNAQLNRQHRGIMQWKGPRTLQWMKHKAENTIDRIQGQFEHSDRSPDIETEV